MGPCLLTIMHQIIGVTHFTHGNNVGNGGDPISVYRLAIATLNLWPYSHDSPSTTPFSPLTCILAASFIVRALGLV